LVQQQHTHNPIAGTAMRIIAQRTAENKTTHRETKTYRHSTRNRRDQTEQETNGEKKEKETRSAEEKREKYGKSDTLAIHTVTTIGRGDTEYDERG
jgi:hypothetical protein